MAVNMERLNYILSVLWLGFVYYFAYTFIYTILPEFIEYWAMGLIVLIFTGALYVTDLGAGHNTIKFVLITLIDFAVSFIFNDFADFSLYVITMGHFV